MTLAVHVSKEQFHKIKDHLVCLVAVFLLALLRYMFSSDKMNSITSPLLSMLISETGVTMPAVNFFYYNLCM